ncbi:NHL repeat-containing protein [Mycolicibacterium fortuitum]|uniref:NHL repeat-containing protein n=2 Tax=Mycolicibacterium fortuitum TaxID=1766 RepID=A0AAE4VIF3_MYCFO|nr:hypothetical protein [Mycolicibacterium fortuitum]MCV7143096.1 hypothetical protein [Mycolicibacterium fortuitum]MDV7189483.1 hypothetical protein [Mycolicibacterium fortuitum]MDV7202480.1 hypothetical protein [Mycolicibacterium fortuitum]MDV7230823.1 hypothetical protein [Mycolicibacterium fortuitum]MDV7256286.1 hypothetical protein [Mycolicibacterium fortuitum]
MPTVTIFREIDDLDFTEKLRGDLAARGWAVRMNGFASDFLDNGYDTANMARSPVLTVMPNSLERMLPCLAKVERLLDAGIDIVTLVPPEYDLPIHFYGRGIRSIIHMTKAHYDRVFEEVFRWLAGPLPAWLDLRMRPSQIHRPTGVSWWSEDIFVADEKYEHVVRIGPTESAVVLPGLSEPHHIHLDRRRLSIANKAADQLLVCDLSDDLAADVQPLVTIGSKHVARPHDIKCAHYTYAVADTDNHRVAYATDTNDVRAAEWKFLEPQIPFRTPCGAFVDADTIWVADTFNHRLVEFSHDGVELQAVGRYGTGPYLFKYPVAIEGWNEYLFVADEQNESLQVYERTENRDNSPLRYVGQLAPGLIQQPFGLSVNRENRLAVGDRKQKCVWIVDLQPAIAEF